MTMLCGTAAVFRGGLIVYFAKVLIRGLPICRVEGVVTICRFTRGLLHRWFERGFRIFDYHFGRYVLSNLGVVMWDVDRAFMCYAHGGFIITALSVSG